MGTLTRYDVLIVRYVLEGLGWIQGAYSNTEGVCLVGAADRAFSAPEDRWKFNEIMALVLDEIEADKHDGLGMVAQWNDYPKRSKVEVFQLLDKVGDKLPAGHRIADCTVGGGEVASHAFATTH